MFRPYHLACNGMNIVFILISVGSKFQLKNRGPVVVVEFLIVEYCVRSRDVGLGQRNFLRLFQGNVGGRLSVFGISRVVIIAVNGYNAGSKAQPFYGFLGAGAHILQEIAAGKRRTGFQLQNNVLFVAVDVIHEKTRFIDFYD